MVGFALPTSGPGDGLWPADLDIEVTNRSGGALAVGDCVQLDLSQSATEVDNSTPGSSDSDGNNSGYNNVVVPDVTGVERHYIHAIALEVIADNASGKVRLRGRVNANVDGATAVGDALIPAADKQLDVATGSSELKVVAIAEEADASNIASVLFDGIHGFGKDS